MRRAELDGLLRDARRAGRAHLINIKRRLDVAVEETWFDRECFDSLVRVYESRNLQPPPWEPSSLGIGEAWLLLHEGVVGLASVAKVQAEKDGKRQSAPWGSEAQNEARLAVAGLVATLAERHKRLPELPFRYRLSVQDPTESAVITGGSLGVAVCVAVASAALGKAASSHVAATAVVRPDGTLGTVSFLKEKLEALAKHQPGVRHVVVAEGQALPGENWPVEVLTCATLSEALVHFGLDMGDFPRADVTAFRQHLAGFPFKDEETAGTAQWSMLADTALTTYRVLQSAGAAYNTQAAEALGWWVLFSAHAGRGADIDRFRCAIVALGDSVQPHVKALIDVFAASAQIDRDPDAAVVTSRAALHSATTLALAKDAVFGRALGTHGRALLHAGNPREAIPFLRRAVDEHRGADPEEVPRSCTYLATGIRMAGDAGAALEVADRAVALLGQSCRHAWATKTQGYLQLERGRCLLDLKRPQEALVAFQEAVNTCELDSDHPRSAALRGLAAAHRSLGNSTAATEHLARCRAIAVAAPSALLRCVAAMALVDVLAKTGRLDLEDERIVAELFPTASDAEKARRLQQTWVY